MLPNEFEYQAIIEGIENDTLNFISSQTGLLFELTANISPNSLENIQFNTNDTLLCYSTNDINKNFEVSLTREFEEQSRLFSVSNGSIAMVDTVKFRIINNQSLKYINIGNPKAYDLLLSKMADDSVTFSFNNISMGANESHIITPDNWAKLDSTNIVLDIDRGNDGTIDSSVILNQYVGVESDESSRAITNFFLSQNYPNPFNSHTTIHYQLPQARHVVIKIYNIMGHEILKRVDENKNAGTYTASWNGKDWLNQELTSGIYFYKIEVSNDKAHSFTKIKKMLYLK